MRTQALTLTSWFPWALHVPQHVSRQYLKKNVISSQVNPSQRQKPTITKSTLSTLKPPPLSSLAAFLLPQKLSSHAADSSVVGLSQKKKKRNTVPRGVNYLNSFQSETDEEEPNLCFLSPCSISGSVQGQVGWGFDQPGLAKDFPVHGRGVGTRWSLNSLPIQTILWFFSINTAWQKCNDTSVTTQRTPSHQVSMCYVLHKHAEILKLKIASKFLISCSTTASEQRRARWRKPLWLPAFCLPTNLKKRRTVRASKNNSVYLNLKKKKETKFSSLEFWTFVMRNSITTSKWS